MMFPKFQLRTYICNAFSYYNINQNWESNNLIYNSIVATYIIIIAKQNVAVSH